MGTWQQSGSTGAWPKVTNLWEMRGWDHSEDILARQYTRASGQEEKLWSLPTFGDFTRHLRTLGADCATRAWQERAREWRVDHRETLLVPSVWCVTHPDWHDAGPRRTHRRP